MDFLEGVRVDRAAAAMREEVAATANANMALAARRPIEVHE
jgi:hypothetical protein